MGPSRRPLGPCLGRLYRTRISSTHSVCFLFAFISFQGNCYTIYKRGNDLQLNLECMLVHIAQIKQILVYGFTYFAFFWIIMFGWDKMLPSGKWLLQIAFHDMQPCGAWVRNSDLPEKDKSINPTWKFIHSWNLLKNEKFQEVRPWTRIIFVSNYFRAVGTHIFSLP